MNETSPTSGLELNQQDFTVLNETGFRKGADRRKSNEESNKPTTQRRKSNRRRQIDPTTCERDYSDAELEFMRAMDDYKRKSGRMFPTCSEILEVLKELGYRKMYDVASEQ